jgi:hypothetical protein
MTHLKKLGLLIALCLVLLPTTLAQQQNRIAGLVLDTNNKPIKGITVRLYRGSQLVGESTTLQDGIYSLSFRPGNTITTIEYYGSEWNPTTISNVSGSKNHTINKVLYRIGDVASNEQQLELLGSLDKLFLISRQNNLSFNQYMARYGAAVEAATKNPPRIEFFDFQSWYPDERLPNDRRFLIAETLSNSTSSVDFTQRSRTLELNFIAGIQEIVVDFVRPFDQSAYTLSLYSKEAEQVLFTKAINQSQNDKVVRLHFRRELFKTDEKHYELSFKAGSLILKVPLLIMVER